LRLAYGLGAKHQTLILKILHDRIEAAMYLAEHIGVGHETIVEDQLGGV